MGDSLSGNGKYTVEVFVGDALLAKPVSWKVATLDVSGLSGSAKAAVDWFAPRPDIAHAFRPAEERPNKLLAMLFTVVVLLPLLFLFAQVSRCQCTALLRLACTQR